MKINVLRKVKELNLGESGFTVPWALEIDSRGFLLLDTGHTFEKKSGGTACLKVTKVAPDKYEIDPSMIYEEYEIRRTYDNDRIILGYKKHDEDVKVVGKVDPRTMEVQTNNQADLEDLR